MHPELAQILTTARPNADVNQLLGAQTSGDGFTVAGGGPTVAHLAPVCGQWLSEQRAEAAEGLPGLHGPEHPVLVAECAPAPQ
jgi:hypothetical protein